MNGESYIPIDPADLGEYTQRANMLLTALKWKPSKKMPFGEVPKGNARPAWSPTPVDQQTEEEVHIMKTLKESISKDALLLSEDATHIVHTIRGGICFGYVLAKLYGKAAGLEELSQLNKRAGALTQLQQGEFAEKQTTMSAVAAFGLAAYVCYHLDGYKEEETSAINIDFPGVPEVVLTNVFRAMECSVFWYGFCLEQAGLAKTDIHAVKLTKLYFRNLLEEVRTRTGSLKHAEFFSNSGYKIKGSDFTVKGFEEINSRAVVGTEFKEVSFEEIVGNQEAKHAARRLAERLVCYDLEKHQNPFQVLGGIPNLSMGYGVPGTGKSLQIAATATLLQQYCKLIGIPFLFWPLPDNVVSTFQGGSAERMIPWMQRMQDKDKIVYGSIDDAENNLEERTRQGVSSGVREVIGVFLRYTEGAYAIQRGNSVIQVFTNIPEQVDKAVLSRIVSRFPIEGATSPHDFYDQDYIWYRRFSEVEPSFVSMTPIAGYQYLADQAKIASLQKIEASDPEVRDNRMLQAFEKARKAYGLKEHGFFAELFRSVKDSYPSFSSRDVRNIQRAIDARLLDFDLPEKWFEDLDLFFRQPYDRKLEMIKELMRDNMKGLSFSQIRYRETIKYLNIVAEITNVERERAITREVEAMRIHGEAMTRLKNQ
jgi:hypothetical protein